MIRYALTSVARRLGVPILRHAKAGDLAYDVCACIEHIIPIEPGQIVVVATGIHFDSTQSHFYPHAFDRSSMAKSGVKVLAGVLDDGFAGELQIVLQNTHTILYTVFPLGRIAQIIFLPVYKGPVELTRMNALPRIVHSSDELASTGN